MKIVKAVAPYIHPGHLNFKTAAYEAWIKAGGLTADSHYPARALHGLAFRYDLPSVMKNSKEARLRFVEPVSIRFDTFPDYLRYEIIPLVWDCWPCYFDKLERWMCKYDVRTAIFTSSQEADEMRRRLPDVNILTITEGIDTYLYDRGKELTDRIIDVLEFGRSNQRVFNSVLPETINHICTNVNGKYLYDNEQLFHAMGDAKITVALPRCDTQPEIAGGIETLTQRYWEAMLSRMIMIGRAPKELTDLIGYNPVIELDGNNANEQIMEILAHIEEYQPLVDRNRKTALELGDWKVRMTAIMEWLISLDYRIR
ncbi:hypothetical protein E5358_13255 [Palleniella muris]|uniref:Uncharacterized protein n=1 Tax=Palleniella muris TaxID=3038145 RepID=A0AC61QM91_9BACT|nr:hypothetical protein [Palleniella muris]TGX80320.1 hypothetical protein E5358_13255 [Palleniella muris]